MVQAREGERRIAAFAVVVAESRVLLSHWTEGRRPAWTLPGGPLGAGEEPRTTAMRYLTLETGHTGLADSQPYAVTDRVVPGRRRPVPSEADLHLVNFLFRTVISGGQLNEEPTAPRAAWFPLAALPRQRIKLVTLALDRAGVDWQSEQR